MLMGFSRILKIDAWYDDGSCDYLDLNCENIGEEIEQVDEKLRYLRTPVDLGKDVGQDLHLCEEDKPDGGGDA